MEALVLDNVECVVFDAKVFQVFGAASFLLTKFSHIVIVAGASRSFNLNKPILYKRNFSTFYLLVVSIVKRRKAFSMHTFVFETRIFGHNIASVANHADK